MARAALGNTGDGINITGQSSATTITSDFIAASTANGVEFGPNASGLTLTATELRATGPGNGVQINGQNVTIGGTSTGQGNTITANTGGIDVEGTAVNYRPGQLLRHQPFELRRQRRRRHPRHRRRRERDDRRHRCRGRNVISARQATAFISRTSPVPSRSLAT